MSSPEVLYEMRARPLFGGTAATDPQDVENRKVAQRAAMVLLPLMALRLALEMPEDWATSLVILLGAAFLGFGFIWLYQARSFVRLTQRDIVLSAMSKTIIPRAELRRLRVIQLSLQEGMVHRTALFLGPGDRVLGTVPQSTYGQERFENMLGQFGVEVVQDSDIMDAEGYYRVHPTTGNWMNAHPVRFGFAIVAAVIVASFATFGIVYAIQSG